MIVGCRIESSEITYSSFRKQPLLDNNISRAASFCYVDIYLVSTNKANTSNTLLRKSRTDKDVKSKQLSCKYSTYNLTYNTYIALIRMRSKRFKSIVLQYD